MLKTFKRVINVSFWTLLVVILLTDSGRPSQVFHEQVRFFTRQIEFDYVNWTLKALFQKSAQAALGTARYLDKEQQQEILGRYRTNIEEQRSLRSQIAEIYADPDQIQPEQAAILLLNRQRQLQHEFEHISLLAEGVLQHQLSETLSANRLAGLGQPLPPVQYHITSVPYALIISPLDVIRQDANISLLSELTLDQIDALEKRVENGLNVSALVVPVGGIGVYPTMVMETTDLPWLAETVAHEWLHNYLTLRPLGILYDSSPEMRTINETTASIAGGELGKQLIRSYYPALAPPEPVEPPPSVDEESTPEVEVTPPEEEPRFDFRAAMHETRVTADAMLADGRIEEAEQYMEQRRLLFLENGYNIRRLNQAYFAFYGAYADTPGGAAGEDPVGEAVRSFRAQSGSLVEFIERIAWVTSFEQLQELVAGK